MQPGQRERDEPADRGLGRQAAGCREGVKAVTRELGRNDIVPDVAGLAGPGQKVSDKLAQMLLYSGEVLTAMYERRELAVVVLVDNERVGLEHGCGA